MTTTYSFSFANPADVSQVASGTFTVDYSAPPSITSFTGTITDGSSSTSIPSASINDYGGGNYEIQAQNGPGNSIAFFYNDDGAGNVTILYGPSPEVDGGSIGVARFFASNAADNDLVVACFARNTLISTPIGSTPVQDLAIGDLILNHQGQSVHVKWIGTQRFHPAFGQEHLPVRISAGALGNDLPVRDLFVSPGHAMYLEDGLLVDAKALINGTTITQMTQWEGDVEYFHIETEHHEIILAEGAPAETFMDNIARTCFNNHSEYQDLYPDAHEMVELDIPRISHKRQLPNAIKNKLEVVATSLLGDQLAVKAA